MQYHLVGGLWLGSVKPDMNKILKPILTRIKKLEDSEKIIRTKVGNKKLKAKLILATFDLIAKAMAMNLTQFNGKYGCPYCLDIGTYEQHRTIYLPSDLHEPRIFSDVILWATMAQEMEEPVYGVFGPSVLSDLIDNFMHPCRLYACNFGRFGKAIYEVLVWIRVQHLCIQHKKVFERD